MDINFIEEVSKALDVLSVERLVRTSPLGSVRCKKCDKILYTATQARYIIIKMFYNENKYMDAYLCKEQEGDNYHVTDLGKRLETVKSNWWRKEIEQKKAALDKLRGVCGVRDRDGSANDPLSLGKQNLVVVDGRVGSVAYAKDLRRKILRALVVPVQGLRKPKAHRLRRQYRPRKRTPRRDTTRRDLPRGETVTKMLSWANGDKFHVDSEHRQCRPRGSGDDFRRRNRAREQEAVRREIERERGAEGA